MGSPSTRGRTSGTYGRRTCSSSNGCCGWISTMLSTTSRGTRPRFSTSSKRRTPTGDLRPDEPGQPPRTRLGCARQPKRARSGDDADVAGERADRAFRATRCRRRRRGAGGGCRAGRNLHRPYGAALEQGRCGKARSAGGNGEAGDEGRARTQRGHDLTVDNLPLLLAAVPNIKEVSIGHGSAPMLWSGYAEAVRRFKSACRIAWAAEPTCPEQIVRFQRTVESVSIGGATPSAHVGGNRRLWLGLRSCT